VTTKLVICPRPPALCGPVEDTGEAAVDNESDGECLTRRAPLAPPPDVLAPGCEADERLAIDEAKRGLLVEVTARDRLPLCN
jgi:hypothetical protein